MKSTEKAETIQFIKQAINELVDDNISDPSLAQIGSKMVELTTDSRAVPVSAIKSIRNVFNGQINKYGSFAANEFAKENNLFVHPVTEHYYRRNKKKKIDENTSFVAAFNNNNGGKTFGYRFVSPGSMDDLYTIYLKAHALACGGYRVGTANKLIVAASNNMISPAIANSIMRKELGVVMDD